MTKTTLILLAVLASSGALAGAGWLATCWIERRAMVRELVAALAASHFNGARRPEEETAR